MVRAAQEEIDVIVQPVEVGLDVREEVKVVKIINMDHHENCDSEGVKMVRTTMKLVKAEKIEILQKL